MTTRNLECLFKPESIALFGASRKTLSVGAVIAHNLQRGFGGPIMLVNPKYREINQTPVYTDIDSLPMVPDLAVIATPPESVAGIIAELGHRGTRAAIVITAGFGEGGELHGVELKHALLAANKPFHMRIVGPNCLGVLVPGSGLNASFTHVNASPGQLAFVTQSGAIVTSMLDWAQARGIGFGYMVSLGDMIDVDFGDMLDYLANDIHTHAILLYIEAINDARKFMSAARAAARMKPVIVVKAGRHAEGVRAAASHTGALAGSDAVYDTAFRRAGMLRVYSLEELFDAAEILATKCKPTGDRLAILTNGGGMGVLATDAVIDEGAQLAELAAETLADLDKVLPSTWSQSNPIDIIGDAPSSRYADALKVLSKDKAIDAILALNCPTALASSTDAAEVVIETAKENPHLPILTSWVGSEAVARARHLFSRHKIPSYDTPEQAVRAFMYMVNYARNQQTLMETPTSVPEDFSTDPERVQKIIHTAFADNRCWLTELEAMEVLGAYEIPVAKTLTAKTPDEAATLATQFSGAVALKIISPDISHKSDVGGVTLELAGPTEVLEAARTMQERILRNQPDARLAGFSVQAMVRRKDAFELIIGVTEDQQFGPTILFGHGGTTVEVVNDQALTLPPLNMRLAREVISRTRVFKLLQGYRGRPEANLDAVALTLIKIAQLIIDTPEVRELDINPLIADKYGVIALDARVRIEKAGGPATSRLAIRPYPRELEELIPLGDGRTLLLRPIRPEDEPSLREAFNKLTPEEIRLRFFAPIKVLNHVSGARFTQLDYDRDMGLILTQSGIPGKTEIFAVVRITADPDNQRAEFAIIVRHDMTALGLGFLLMRRIIEYARSRGIGEIYGDVLRENSSMLKLCEVLGFQHSLLPDEPTVTRVSLVLSQ